jgi:hypothetical protein
MRQPSACTVTGVVQTPFSRRAAWMSRVSSSLRLRYTTSSAAALTVRSVWQQSQTRASISRPSIAPAGVSTAPRKVIAPAVAA